MSLGALHGLAATARSAEDTPPGVSKQKKVVAGYIARAVLPDLGVELKAKLDTGADSSSIHAPSIEVFDRKGRRWARSEIVNAAGSRTTIERRILRTVTIKRSGSLPNKRFVVRLNVCVAGLTAGTDFTLADRRQLKYPVLIGRRFLKDRILVDSSSKMMHPKKVSLALVVCHLCPVAMESASWTFRRCAAVMSVGWCAGRNTSFHPVTRRL